jgi:hypothetical protein
MQAVCFHPQIQNSSSILPIYSAGGTVWGTNTVRGKKCFSSPYLYGRAMGLTQLSVQGTGVLFPVNGRRIVALTSPPDPAGRLRLGTSVFPLTLNAYIPCYSMIFDIDNYDNYYYIIKGRQQRCIS